MTADNRRIPLSDVPTEELRRRLDNASLMMNGLAINNFPVDEANKLVLEAEPELLEIQAELSRRKDLP